MKGAVADTVHEGYSTGRPHYWLSYAFWSLNDWQRGDAETVSRWLSVGLLEQS